MTKKMNYRRIAPLLVTLLTVNALSACGGSDSGSPALGSGGSSGTPSRTTLGSEATGPNTITLALRYVSFLNSAGTPVISRERAGQIVQRVNELYKPCDIRFTLEEFLPVVPAEYGLPYGLSSMSQLNPTRGQFDVMDRIVVINTGNWNHSTMGSANAWTNMPGYNPPGAVLEAQVATNAEIVAHEIGHYLNLGHTSNPANLLNPIIYKTSTELTKTQCGIMRQSAVDSWSAARR